MAPDEQQPDPPDQPRTDQQIFDAKVAQHTRLALPILGGIGVMGALIMSTIALVQANNHQTTTVLSAPAPVVTRPAALTGDALGKKIFTAGVPSAGVLSCGGCHTLAAAGTTAKIGPNLDKELAGDPASATLESIIDPAKEVVPGFPANVMPTNYRTGLTNAQLSAVTDFVYHTTNTKYKKAHPTSP